MKLKYYLYTVCFFIASIVIFSSCERIEDVDTPVFDVKVDKETYRVGDSVKFTFSGNPDIISFFSGELGYNYDYTSGRIAEPDYLINFETQNQLGAQVDQMKILVSKDFDEDYSIEGVHRATWTDITDRFNMAPPSHGTAYVSSGMGSFSDLLDIESDTTSLYFAVKQVVLDQEEHGLGSLNRLRYFTISSVYEILTTRLYEHPNMGWQLFSTANKQPARAALENINTIMMRNSWWRSDNGGAENPDGIDFYRENTEDWAVSTKIAVPKKLDMGPDKSQAIKGLRDVGVKSFTYTYNTPGVYKVVFKGINANVESYKEVLRELTIEVTN